MDTNEKTASQNPQECLGMAANGSFFDSTKKPHISASIQGHKWRHTLTYHSSHGKFDEGS